MTLAVEIPKVSRLDDKPHSPVVYHLQHDASPFEQVIGLKNDILSHLHQTGAVLLRSGQFGSPDKVEQITKLFMQEVLTNNTEHRPANNKGLVQRPVEYSNQEFLLWHNENTFNWRFPHMAIFACEQTATFGGQTPIADSRTIIEHLPKELVAEFIGKQVMYVRNLQPDDFIGLGWKTVFQTENKSEVESKCRAQRLDFEWRGDALITRAVRPAVVTHPINKSLCWITQALHWHFSCLSDEIKDNLSIMFDAEIDYPRNCYFGNGDKIPDATMAKISAAYKATGQQFDWQNGDLLLVDNVLKAHARTPYQGERRILVCFGNPISFSQL